MIERPAPWSSPPRGAAAVALAFALASASVFPGLFDFTLTSRLAILPALACILLAAGSRGIPAGGLAAGAALATVPAVSVLWSAIPAQSFPQIVRWASFGIMTAGVSGITAAEGRRSAALGAVAGALACAAIELALPGDLPSGNPNRPGPILAMGIVALATGMTGLTVVPAAATALVISAALVRSGFVTAWIAVGAGLFVTVAARRTLLPGRLAPVLALVALSLFTVFPGIAARIHPSLELRAEIWRAAVLDLVEAGPLGTGAGQARLLSNLREDARVAELAGPDRRVDELHSDLLTPVVEQGLPGLVMLAAIAFLLSRARPDGGGLALLACACVFAAFDLPLATPMGALPLACALGVALGRTGRRASLHPALVVSSLAASAVWMGMLIAGYSLFETGRAAGLAGNHAEAGRILGRASRLLPFEERIHLMRASALRSSGAGLAAMEEAERFNGLYPLYWQGWVLEAEIASEIGRTNLADSAWLEALACAPEFVPDRNLMAFNASRAAPRDSALLEITAGAFLAYPPPGGSPAFLLDYASRAGAVASSLEAFDPEVAGYLSFLAASVLEEALEKGADRSAVGTVASRLPPVPPGAECRRRWEMLISTLILPGD